MNRYSRETRRESNEKTARPRRNIEILLAMNARQEYTARELMHALGYSERNAISPRLTEMEAVGLVSAVGKRYDTETRRSATLYAITDDGIAWCECINSLR